MFFLIIRDKKRGEKVGKKVKTDSGIPTLYVVMGMIVTLIVGFVAGYYTNAGQREQV